MCYFKFSLCLVVISFQFSTALATYDTLYLFLIKVQYNVHSFLIVIGKNYACVDVFMMWGKWFTRDNNKECTLYCTLIKNRYRVS